jgi:hypothetical protein
MMGSSSFHRIFSYSIFYHVPTAFNGDFVVVVVVVYIGFFSSARMMIVG